MFLGIKSKSFSDSKWVPSPALTPLLSAALVKSEVRHATEPPEVHVALGWKGGTAAALSPSHRVISVHMLGGQTDTLYTGGYIHATHILLNLST